MRLEQKNISLCSSIGPVRPGFRWAQMPVSARQSLLGVLELSSLFVPGYPTARGPLIEIKMHQTRVFRSF